MCKVSRQHDERVAPDDALDFFDHVFQLVLEILPKDFSVKKARFHVINPAGIITASAFSHTTTTLVVVVVVVEIVVVGAKTRSVRFYPPPSPPPRFRLNHDHCYYYSYFCCYALSLLLLTLLPVVTLSELGKHARRNIAQRCAFLSNRNPFDLHR